MPNQLFATLRNLDDLGVSPPALASIPDRRKLANLRFGSAHFESCLRKRYALPLKPWIEDVDASGLTLGATVAQTGTPTIVQDIAIRFRTGGVAGAAGILYQVSVDAGVTYGAILTLSLSGQLVVDGVTTTFAGTLAASDVLTYSTAVDAALRGHVVAFAGWKLLHNRGLDPEVEQDLQGQYDAAIKWGEAVRVGDALLAPEHDSTPDTSEEGPLYTGQTGAQDFLDVP